MFGDVIISVDLKFKWCKAHVSWTVAHWSDFIRAAICPAVKYAAPSLAPALVYSLGGRSLSLRGKVNLHIILLSAFVF